MSGEEGLGCFELDFFPDSIGECDTDFIAGCDVGRDTAIGVGARRTRIGEENLRRS